MNIFKKDKAESKGIKLDIACGQNKKEGFVGVGTPDDVSKKAASFTGHYLKRLLKE
jgi:excinuclease UvrABC ATPase subunit